MSKSNCAWSKATYQLPSIKNIMTRKKETKWHRRQSKEDDQTEITGENSLKSKSIDFTLNHKTCPCDKQKQHKTTHKLHKLATTDLEIPARTSWSLQNSENITPDIKSEKHHPVLPTARSPKTPKHLSLLQRNLATAAAHGGGRQRGGTSGERAGPGDAAGRLGREGRQGPASDLWSQRDSWML